MGQYIYSVRAKSKKTNIGRVHLLGYLYKVSWSGGSDPVLAMMAGKAERYWEGRTLPKYVVVEEFKDGAPVLEWHGSVLANDTPKFPGTLVGHLRGNEVIPVPLKVEVS